MKRICFVLSAVLAVFSSVSCSKSEVSVSVSYYSYVNTEIYLAAGTKDDVLKAKTVIRPEMNQAFSDFGKTFTIEVSASSAEEAVQKADSQIQTKMAEEETRADAFIVDMNAKLRTYGLSDEAVVSFSSNSFAFVRNNAIGSDGQGVAGATIKTKSIGDVKIP